MYSCLTQEIRKIDIELSPLIDMKDIDLFPTMSIGGGCKKLRLQKSKFVSEVRLLRLRIAKTFEETIPIALKHNASISNCL